RTPCPVCTRIIKVPELVKHDPTDWRTLQARGPSAARQTVESAHEEGWRSASTAGVSREALVQTGAIAEQVDRDARRQRHIRFTQIAIAVVVLALGGLGAYSFVARGKADKYL